jgi:multidrug resistance efflux pump
MRNYLATTANLTAELEELKKKLAVLERTDSNKQLAINKISKDIDNIYLAIAALSITAPPVQKPKPINRIGFKQNSTKK